MCRLRRLRSGSDNTFPAVLVVVLLVALVGVACGKVSKSRESLRVVLEELSGDFSGGSLMTTSLVGLAAC